MGDGPSDIHISPQPLRTPEGRKDTPYDIIGVSIVYMHYYMCQLFVFIIVDYSARPQPFCHISATTHKSRSVNIKYT